MEIKRNKIYMANLQASTGSVQNGIRPVIVIQNNTGNIHSPTTLIVPVTSKITKHKIPTHFEISGLCKPSIGLCEQVQTISKSQIIREVGELTQAETIALNQSLKISLALEF